MVSFHLHEMSRISKYLGVEGRGGGGGEFATAYLELRIETKLIINEQKWKICSLNRILAMVTETQNEPLSYTVGR